MPAQIRSWFHISDLDRAVRAIDGIASPAINLTESDFQAIAGTFDVPEYFPDGKPNIRSMPTGHPDQANVFTPIGNQAQVLIAAETWLADDSCALMVKGMVSTGKRTLLPQLLKHIEAAGLTPQVVAPNARIARRYSSPQIGECTSIYQTLYSSKSSGTVKKSSGEGIAGAGGV